VLAHGICLDVLLCQLLKRGQGLLRRDVAAAIFPIFFEPPTSAER
jgi:hypothetical protein